MFRETFVCGDIGGSNTRFTLYEVHANKEFSSIDLRKASKLPGEVIFKKKYNNEDYPSFASVLRTFLYQHARMDRPPASACFAVAGTSLFI
jgi:glucokinase